MGKSFDQNVGVEEEFVKLEHALNQTATDTAVCLKLLKKELSEYDTRNGNHFTHTATSYVRNDMRAAKDTTHDLKRVADEMSSSRKPSKAEITNARNAMNATARAMETLKATGRNYDKENKQSRGIKGTIDAAIGGHHHEKKDEHHGVFGGKDEHKHHGDRSGGLFGKHEKDEHHHQGGFLHSEDKNGGGMMGTTDSVEVLVEKTLRDHFSLSALDHQITAADKALSPSMMERAKETMHDVKDKMTGHKTSPSHHDHLHSKQTVTP